MTEKTEDTSFSYLKTLHFGGVLKSIENGGYVSPLELALLIRTRDNIAVPDEVLDHIAVHLAGEAKKPKGRPADNSITRNRRDMFIAVEYSRLLTVLQAGYLSADDIEMYGEEEAEAERDFPPSVRAARLVARLFLSGAESHQRVLNIASSNK